MGLMHLAYDLIMWAQPMVGRREWQMPQSTTRVMYLGMALTSGSVAVLLTPFVISPRWKMITD